MKKRVRLGVKVRLPFGLFPNAGIVVLLLSVTDAQRVERAVKNLGEVLHEVGYDSYAQRLVCEVE